MKFSGEVDQINKINSLNQRIAELEKQLAEKELELDNSQFIRRYKSVLDNIGVGISLISPDMKILDLNNKMKDWYPKIDVSKKPLCFNAFNDPPRDDLCIYCPTVKTLKDGKIHESITETPMGNENINFRIVSSAIKNSEGKIIAAIEVVEDITDRIKAENDHKESEEKFRAVTESTIDAILITDSERIITFLNQSLLKLFGYSATELYGKPVSILIPEKYEKNHLDGIELLKSDEMFKTGKTSIVIGLKKDGTEFPCEMSLSAWKSGKNSYYTSIIRDLTERKMAERALRKSEKQLHDIFNHLPDATFVINCDGKVILWNKALEDMLQVKAVDMIGEGNYAYSIPFYGDRRPVLIDLINKTDENFLNNHYFNIKRDEHSIMAETFLSKFKDDEGVFLWAKASPLYDEKGKLMGAIESIRDITDMKNVEIQLQEYQETLEEQVEERTKDLEKANESLKNVITKHEKTEVKLAKLIVELQRSNEELEQFAYVASHDLQEPLRMISSFTQLLEKQYGDKLNDDAQEYINYVVDGAKRMHELINDLLAYSRVTTHAENFIKIDTNEVVDKALFNLEITIEENEAIIKANHLPEIYADHSQMVQLFQNLIGNAIKYRGDEPPDIRISAQKSKDDWVFQVSDNGIGIAHEYYERIFQIFQRLHEIHVYSGTGVGLAICKKIVERHGGHIWLESQIGKGSTFYFSIPR